MSIKFITRTAMVAALYAALTIAVFPLSYKDVQFRISEVLVLLCFYRKDYQIGLIIGCFLANLFSPMSIDILVGTFATAISVFFIARSKNLLIASFYPVVFNGIVIGLELYYLGFIPEEVPLFVAMIQVAIGEMVVVSIIGVLLFKNLEKNRAFMQLIEADQNIRR